MFNKLKNKKMKNKTILLIGGSGALGNILTQRWHSDNKIIIMSRNEIRQEAMKLNYPNLIYRVGDVKDKESLTRIIHEFKPQIIVNAAAIKTVWVSQDNPWETVLTNVLGHQNLVDVVRQCSFDIESLMFISTDKACSPINVYGMTKAIAEQIYVNFAKEQTKVKVSLCRYGNVINSTGSIIQQFKERIQRGESRLPITHFDMTRFLLTLDEAVDLIEWSYSSPKSHGKIVVPIIPSVKIIDFSKAIAKHFGNTNIDFYKIPIRQGEKLHEEMISSTEFQRVEKGSSKYYLIGHERNNEDYTHLPLNSSTSLIDSDKVYDFLVDKGLLKL